MHLHLLSECAFIICMLCWRLFLLKWVEDRGKGAVVYTLELFPPPEHLSDAHISSISHLYLRHRYAFLMLRALT